MPREPQVLMSNRIISIKETLISELWTVKATLWKSFKCGEIIALGKTPFYLTKKTYSYQILLNSKTLLLELRITHPHISRKEKIYSTRTNIMIRPILTESNKI